MDTSSEDRIKNLEIAISYLQKEVDYLTEILMNLDANEIHYHYTVIYPNQQSKDEFLKSEE